MAEVDLERVESSRDRDARCAGEVGGDAGDVLGGDGAREAHAQRAEHPRRREARQRRPGRVGDGSRVAELGCGGRALGMNRVGESSQSGDRLVAQQYLSAVGPAFGRHRAVGDRRHADTARGNAHDGTR